MCKPANDPLMSVASIRRIAATLLVAWVALAAAAAPARAQPDAGVLSVWEAVLAEAEGQTVYFNAWGGDENINAYIAWVGEEVSERFGVTLEHVRLTDTAEAVSRILAERTAGRESGGSVDLIWINGENFAAMRDNGLLGAPFTDDLPSFSFINTAERPNVLVDFGVPTGGQESPWGMAQLVFMHDTAFVPEPPRSLDALLDWARRNPGRFAYPQPPDFIGTTFLKQVLLTFVPDFGLLARPVDETNFDTATEPLWEYLDALHPNLWRGGETFPTSGPQLIQLLDDGEIEIAFTFNPGEASSAIESGRLPDTVRTYVLHGGTIGNTHFVAIPFNASARAGAMVVADFLLSPEAQHRKQDPRVWGDPTVLSMDRLPVEWRHAFDDLPLGIATLAPAELGQPLLEPHPSWVDALEAAWLERYGS